MSGRLEGDLDGGRLALQVELALLAVEDAALGDEADRHVLKVRQPVPLDGLDGEERRRALGAARRVVEGSRQERALLLPLGELLLEPLKLLLPFR